MTSRFFRWIRYFTAADRTPRRPKRTRLALEHLEDRTVPTAITWTGNSDHATWNDTGNWDLNRLPQAGDDVSIPAVAGTASVKLSGTAANVDSLTCFVPFNLAGTGLTTTGGGTVAKGGVNMNNHGVFSILQGGVLHIIGGNQALDSSDSQGAYVFGDNNTLNAISILGGATLTLTNATSLGGGRGTISGSGAFTNQGVVSASDNGLTVTINTTGGFTNASGAFLSASLGGNITLASAFTNNGTLNVFTASTISATGAFSNFSGSTLTGGTYTVGGTFKFTNANIVNNAADITLTGAGSVIQDTLGADALANFSTNAAAGVFTITSGRNFTIGMPFANAGHVSVKTGSTLTVNSSIGGAGLVDIVGAGEIDLNNGSITGGTLTNSATGIVRGVSGVNTLGGTLNNPAGGQIIVNNGTVLALQTGGTYTNAGNIALNSTNSNTDLRINGDVTLGGGGTVTLSNNPNNRVYGFGSNDRLTNVDNTIQGAGQLGVAFMALTNQGTILANQSNALIVSPGLAGAVNSGTLQASSGATLRLQSGTFTNTGGTINAQDTSVVELNLATITGGTLSTAGTGVVRNTAGSTLDTVTNTGAFDVANASVASLKGTITNSGTITVSAVINNTDLQILGNVTLTGGGIVTLSNNANNRIYGQNASDRLTNVNNTIQGGGQIGVDGMALTNQGSIVANQSNALVVDPSSSGAINSATLRATGGATLRLLNGSFANGGGTIDAQNNSTVELSGASITGGTLSTAGNGVVRNVAGSTLTTLTNAGALDVANATVLSIAGTITNTGTITVSSTGNNTDLQILGNTTLTGGGTVTLSNNPNNRIYGSTSTDRLTNANNTIQGAGQIGISLLALTNQGTILANQSNTLVISPSASGVTNSGTFHVNAGSTLRVTNDLTNYSGTTLTGGTYEVFGTMRLASADIVTNAATILLDGSASQLLRDDTGFSALTNLAANTGSLTLQNAHIVTTLGDLANNGGTVTIDATNGGTPSQLFVGGSYNQSGGGVTTLTAGGTLTIMLPANAANLGSGTFLVGIGIVNGSIVDAGTINPNPNSNPGTITVNGNVTFNGGATYVERLAGTTPGTGYSQLAITGNETISNSASLTGSRLASFVPSVGTTFLIHPVTGTVSGTFAQGSSIVIGDITFNISYQSATGVTLTTAAPTTVYVDDTWAGTTMGADPANDPIGGLVFGYDAFSDVQSALNQAAIGATVVIFGGGYSGALNVGKDLAEIQTAVNTTTPAQNLVTLAGTLGLNAPGGFTTFDTTTAGLSISAQVSGTDNLVKVGGGVVILSNANNSYSGGTTLSTGTLSISADGSLGAVPGAPQANNITFTTGVATLQLANGAATVTLSANRGIDIVSNSSFDIAGGEVLVIAGNVSGGGGINKNGPGDLQLTPATGTNNPGNIGVFNGRLLFDSQTALGNGSVAVGSGTTGLVYLGAANLSLANALNLSSGSDVATRLGQLTLPASTVLPTSGSILFNNDELPTNTIILPADDTLGGNLTVQVGGNNATVGAVDWTGKISGAFALTKTQPGTLTLGGTNTYTGGTTINGGTVQVAADNNLGNGGGVTINAGALDVTSGFSTARAFTLGNSAATIGVDPGQTLTLTTAIGGAGSLTKTGGGTLILTGLANTFGGANQATNINGGIVNISGDAGLGNAANALTFNGGSLQPTASFSIARAVTLNAGGGTIDTNGSNLTLAAAGTLSGAGGLTKVGTGTLTLAGTNTYSGTTNVNGGTLLVSANLGSTNPLIVNNSATLAGGATIGGPLVVNNGGTFSPGSGATPGKFTVSGNTTLNAGATLNIKLGGKTTPGTDYDQVVVNGTATLAGTLNVSLVNGFQPAAADTFQILNFTNESGDFTTRNGFNLGNGLFLAEQFTPNNNPTALNLIVDQQPTITSANHFTFTEQINGTFPITTIGVPTPSIMESGNLPPNVVFQDNGDGTASLSGTPLAGTSGTYNITLTAHNGVGSDFVQAFTLTVVVGPTVGNPTVTPNTALQESITNFSVTGTFTDSAGAAAGPYTATVNWGDGTHNTGTVSGNANPFNYSFNGTHAYATIGNFSVSVTITDKNGGSATSIGQVVAVNSTSGPFTYDANTKTVTITGTNFTFAQSTVADNTGPHTTYFLTMDTVTQSFADVNLAHVVVNGQGANPTAILIVNDTYVDTNNMKQETRERISLGSLANAGVGTMQKFDAQGNAVNFLTLSGFPVSYAYVGRNDGTVLLYGTQGVAYNGFVSAGNYSYVGAPGLFHLAQGATSVYGYSAGQASDFAYHYAANPGSAFVSSGVAFSYMSAMDTVNGVTQSYFNVGAGFQQNTGVAKNPGKDYAYLIDSPGSDNFVGLTQYSYMYIQNANGSFAELNTAYGFALVFGQSFVGGVDFATNNDPNKNILVGFRPR